MMTPKEFYKEHYPEEFSDSVVIRVSKLDQDLFAYYLDTLTSNSKESEFEDFCRRIAQNEICPNLIPHTGPTGGGDSKVDSETYPVSEYISEKWYYGSPSAGKERWAFAISAKHDWKPKVKSDVTKIIKVNADQGRNYTRIFFMSNQYIPDKKRADAEDELRKEFSIDVRILDRNWFIDKVIGNRDNTRIAVETLHLSDNFLDEIKIGAKDALRQQQFDANEQRMLAADVKASELVKLSLENVMLARELEYPYEKVKGLIHRGERMADTYGLTIDKATAIYEASRTIFWWYDDPDEYVRLYEEYERLATSTKNIHLFQNLITMWMNLYRLSADKILAKSGTDADSSQRYASDPLELASFYNAREHLKVIQEEYNYYISDATKPNTILEANASYFPVRVFTGDPLDDIIDDLIKLLDQSELHIDLNLENIFKMVVELPIFSASNKYDALFEKAVSVASTKKEKQSAAIMLVERAEAIENEQPYKAISYYSRTLMSLYNNENKSLFIKVIFHLAKLFESENLLWAARNFYIFDFCLCLNQYMKYGEMSPAMIASASALKYVELQLGHVINSLIFDRFLRIAKSLYPQEIPNAEEEDRHYDALLGIQIFKTPHETEMHLLQLPEYLENNGYIFSNIALNYDLGHYNEALLQEYGGSKDKVDSFIGMWQNQPVLEQMKAQPWYGVEGSLAFETSVLGCNIYVDADGPFSHGELEIGSSVLACIESFFGTAVSQHLISITGKIHVHLQHVPEQQSFALCEVGPVSNCITMKFGDYDSTAILKQQEDFSNCIVSLIATICDLMFNDDTSVEKFKALVESDEIFQRTASFANSVFIAIETLGINVFSYEKLVEDCDATSMLLDHKPIYTSESVKPKAATDHTTVEHHKVIFDKIPDDIHQDISSNSEVQTSSVINLGAWDQSHWCGLLFLNPSYIHGIALLFENESCQYIFQEWIRDIGAYDKEDIIGIRVIKKYDKLHPYWYRVAIGDQKMPDVKGPKLFMSPVRFQNMEAESNNNIDMYELASSNWKQFKLFPAIIDKKTEQPKLFYELAITKNISSIRIENEWDISEPDLIEISAVLPSDDPVVLTNNKSPILNIIETKKQLLKNKALTNK